MGQNSFLPKSIHWFWLLVPAILVGGILRLHDLPGQILIDDEWHSLNFVIGKPFLSVLFGQGLGANCIPQNIYNYVLLHSLGWSEMLLRMPSILCGILSLIIFPLLISRIHNRFTAIVFAWLLAISPCTIFYSRLCRPYAMVLFFGFLALLSMILWLHQGKKCYMFLYAFSGFLAIYYHLYAVIPILAPLPCLFLLAICPKGWCVRIRKYPLPSIKMIFTAGAIIAVPCLSIILPATLKNPWWYGMVATSRATSETLFNYISLLGGTHVPALEITFVLLACAGAFLLIRDDPPVGAIVLSIFLLFFIGMAISRQDGIHAAIQVARYGIILFPLALLLVSVALNGLFEKTRLSGRSELWWMLPVPLFIGGLFVGSPLWGAYASPNNFTNHSAFQDSYRPMDWSKSRVRDLSRQYPQMRRQDIPGFYFDAGLLAGVEGVIEYPMFIGDTFNLYYYYQHFHKKKVVAGCVPGFRFEALSSSDQWVFSDTVIDYVLSRASVNQGAGMHFKNVVSLTDFSLLGTHYRHWVVVIHKKFFKEIFRESKNNEYFHPPRVMGDFLSKNFGKPVYEDEYVITWMIP